MSPTGSGGAGGLSWPLSVPVLSDGVVTLRAHTRADLADGHAMSIDPLTQRWTTVPIPYPIEAAEDYYFGYLPRCWDEGTSRGWAIEAVDESGVARFAGNLDLRGGPVAEIGSALHPWARGRGLMRRSVDLACEYAFTEAGIGSVIWRTEVGNEASLRVAHAAGFTLAALVPGTLPTRDGVADAWLTVRRFGDPPLPRSRWLTVPTTGTPPADLPGVRLRELTAADVPRIVQACSDPVTRQWLHRLPTPYTPADALAYVHLCTWDAARGAGLTWALADPDDDRLLGVVGVMDLAGYDTSAGEIGYWLHPDARGRRLLGAVLPAVIEHAFDPAGLDRRRLTAAAAVNNSASVRILERAGLQRDGIRASAEPLGDGSFADLVEFSLLRTPD